MDKGREAFEKQHTDKAFEIVRFDETKNRYCLHDNSPLTELNLNALAVMNYGWSLWQKRQAEIDEKDKRLEKILRGERE